MKISRRVIREYAESLAIAFVLAMVIRHFVVEAFRIPTSSMEPTLIGNQSHGDRILVNKFQYDLHPPRAWDVVVFKIEKARINYYKGERLPGAVQADNGTVTHPGSPEHDNYVKRLVGLPGQRIQVIDGDVFINGTIARKPERVEDSMLVPVTSDEHLKLSKTKFFDNWSKSDADAVSLKKDGSITLAGSKRKCGVRYFLKIEDEIKSSSGGPRQGSRNRVGDLRLAFRFTHTGGAGNLTCELKKTKTETIEIEVEDTEGTKSEKTNHEAIYTFVVPLGKPGEVATILCSDGKVAKAAKPFAPTGEHLIEFSAIDARATIRIDGEVLAVFENTDPKQSSAKHVSRMPTSRSSAKFGAAGCDVSARDVRIWRDIYYTSVRLDRPSYAVGREFKLGEGEYFMMGDNSPSSFDSRSWGVVKESSLIGSAFFVFWPLHRWRFIN